MAIELPAVRILIVDDDRAICDYMQTLLERDGYEVKTLSDPTHVEDEVRTGRLPPHHPRPDDAEARRHRGAASGSARSTTTSPSSSSPATRTSKRPSRR